MKQVFLCLLVVWALGAFCCTVEINQSQMTNLENGQEQGQKPVQQPVPPETGGNETGGNEAGGNETGGNETGGNEAGGNENGETQYFVLEEGGEPNGEAEKAAEGETTEIELPIEVPPVVIPPIVVQPVVVVPIVPPTVIVKPVIVKPVIVQPVVEPPEIIPLPPFEPPVPPEEEPPLEPPEEELSETLLLEINEVCAEFSIISKRAEYIEFKVKGAGNMKGLQVHIMYEAENPFIYNFPAIDVAEGEYITLHLRTLDNNCIDELGDNVSVSGGIDSCPTARDLWVAGSNKWLHKTDIIIVQDTNGVIHDALCMNETPGKPWNSNQAHFTEILKDLYNKSAWNSPDGVNTSTMTVYNSVNRREGDKNTRSVNDWYISVNTTPGLPNK